MSPVCTAGRPPLAGGEFAPRRRRVVTRLGREDGELRALGALATACEIVQQPAMLRKTHAVLLGHKDRLERFLRPLLDRATTRVILAGAGTSAFIGECLVPSPTQLPLLRCAKRSRSTSPCRGRVCAAPTACRD